MSLLDSLDSMGGMNMGAMGAALGKSREQRMADRAEAIQSGQSVQSTEDIEKKVRGVAEDFVSVFMNQVMKSMRATVHENPSMHGDNGEKFFQEMLDTEQSKSLAKGSGYGLTDLIYESMMTNYRMRDAASANGAAVAQAPVVESTELESETAAEERPDLVVAAIE